MIFRKFAIDELTSPRRDVTDPELFCRRIVHRGSAFEMTYIVSGGALNSTHSLTHSSRGISDSPYMPRVRYYVCVILCVIYRMASLCYLVIVSKSFIRPVITQKSRLLPRSVTANDVSGVIDYLCCDGMYA